MSPPTITATMESGKGIEWFGATEAKVQSLWEDQVFEEVDKPASKKVIETGRVPWVKKNAEGKLD